MQRRKDAKIQSRLGLLAQQQKAVPTRLLFSRGFTLAEVLITLGVIGVVAALTMPQLVSNMNNYAFAKAKETNLLRIKEATNQMKVNNALDGYATADAFVDELQKYIKISKRCDSFHLAECFAPEIVKSAGGEIDATTLTSSTKLGQNAYTTPTVALALANGTTMLFSYDPNCARIEPEDNQSDTTGCMALLYDINGMAKPNQIGKDIATQNAAIDAFKLGNFWVSTGDTTGYAPDGTYDSGGGVMKDDYWAGAIKACAAQGLRLPTKDELAAMYFDACGVPPNTICSTTSVRGSKHYGTATNYLTSTEFSSVLNMTQNFSSGYQGAKTNDYQGKVRCVR